MSQASLLNISNATSPSAPSPPAAGTTIYANPSDGRLIIFIGLNVVLWLTFVIVVLYLSKVQRDFAAKMNLIRRDRGRASEKVTDRTVFDFNHSPDTGEIVEPHDRVMAALSLDKKNPLGDSRNPLHPFGSKPGLLDATESKFNAVKAHHGEGLRERHSKASFPSSASDF